MAQDEGVAGQGEELGLARLQTTIGFLLLGGWRFANSCFNQHFKHIEITPASYGVLLLIEGNPGCSIGSVGRAMGIAPNSIARLVDGLVARDLVDKRVSKADARTRLLELTGEGRKFLALLEQQHAKYESEIIDAFGKDRHDALCVLLRPFVGAGPVEELDRF
ncbi:MarR family winged helix-turn-helix transcriptional regulator [Aurantiacibacter suaedae]|uniref:MarR family winged helix-turn-helix transcriptional regulator n=1 Tax=Aurantiacibacter suaedae TaxID=2545755 RepID=UPI00138696C6|nr:MarR family transcriptional regulator [Aurantiacibacter suaedae]